MKKIFCYILFLLLVTSPTFAATVYVDNGATGCSTPSDTDYDSVTRTCGSGSSTVYNTVAGAVNSRSSGDTVLIRAGSYTEGTEINTPANNLTVTGDGKDLVTITGYFVVDTNNNNISGFRIGATAKGYAYASLRVSGNYNLVHDIKHVGKAPDHCMLYLSGTYNEVYSSLWDHGVSLTRDIGHHTGSNDSAALEDSSKSWTTNEHVGRILVNATDKNSYCTITANTATTATCTLANGNSGAENLWDLNDNYYIGDGAGSIPINFSGSNNLVRDSIFRGLAHIHAITLFGGTGTNLTFRKNLMYNIGQVDNTIHADLFQSAYDQPTYIYWENNKAYNISGQIGNVSNDSRVGTTGHWHVRGNTFIGTWHMNVGIPYFYFYNNTVVHSYPDVYGLRWMCTGVNGTWDSSNGLVKNNAFIGNGSYGGDHNNYGWWGFESPSTCTGNVSSNNYVSKRADYSTPFAAKTGWNTSDGNVNGGNPQFSDLATYDVSIESASVLRNAGANLSSLWSGATDPNGTTRGEDGTWDIGAYEYGAPAGPPDLIAPIITSFTMPSHSRSLTANISSFTCTDETSLNATPYCVATTNDSGTCSWSAAQPTSVTFSDVGVKTAYAFCRDSASTPNISTVSQATTRVAIPGSMCRGCSKR